MEPHINGVMISVLASVWVEPSWTCPTKYL